MKSKVPAFPQPDQIVTLAVQNSLTQPCPLRLINYPGVTARLKNPLVLRGVDIAEVRVLEVDQPSRSVRVCFHAALAINPETSTGRAILLSYLGMRNTVYYVLQSPFRKKKTGH